MADQMHYGTSIRANIVIFTYFLTVVIYTIRLTDAASRIISSNDEGRGPRPLDDGISQAALSWLHRQQAIFGGYANTSLGLAYGKRRKPISTNSWHSTTTTQPTSVIQDVNTPTPYPYISTPSVPTTDSHVKQQKISVTSSLLYNTSPVTLHNSEVTKHPIHSVIPISLQNEDLIYTTEDVSESPFRLTQPTLQQETNSKVDFPVVNLIAHAIEQIQSYDPKITLSSKEYSSTEIYNNYQMESTTLSPIKFSYEPTTQIEKTTTALTENNTYKSILPTDYLYNTYRYVTKTTNAVPSFPSKRRTILDKKNTEAPHQFYENHKLTSSSTSNIISPLDFRQDSQIFSSNSFAHLPSTTDSSNMQLSTMNKGLYGNDFVLNSMQAFLNYNYSNRELICKDSNSRDCIKEKKKHETSNDTYTTSTLPFSNRITSVPSLSSSDHTNQYQNDAYIRNHGTEGTTSDMLDKSHEKGNSAESVGHVDRTILNNLYQYNSVSSEVIDHQQNNSLYQIMDSLLLHNSSEINSGTTLATRSEWNNSQPGQSSTVPTNSQPGQSSTLPAMIKDNQERNKTLLKSTSHDYSYGPFFGTLHGKERHRKPIIVQPWHKSFSTGSRSSPPNSFHRTRPNSITTAYPWRSTSNTIRRPMKPGTRTPNIAMSKFRHPLHRPTNHFKGFIQRIGDTIPSLVSNNSRPWWVNHDPYKYTPEEDVAEEQPHDPYLTPEDMEWIRQNMGVIGALFNNQAASATSDIDVEGASVVHINNIKQPPPKRLQTIHPQRFNQKHPNRNQNQTPPKRYQNHTLPKPNQNWAPPKTIPNQTPPDSTSPRWEQDNQQPNYNMNMQEHPPDGNHKQANRFQNNPYPYILPIEQKPSNFQDQFSGKFQGFTYPNPDLNKASKLMYPFYSRGVNDSIYYDPDFLSNYQGLPILFYPEYDYGGDNSSLLGLTSLTGYPSNMEQLYPSFAIGQGQVQNQSQSVVNTVHSHQNLIIQLSNGTNITALYVSTSGDGSANEGSGSSNGDGSANGGSGTSNGVGSANGGSGTSNGDGSTNGGNGFPTGDGSTNGGGGSISGNGSPNGGGESISGNGSPNGGGGSISGDGLPNGVGGFDNGAGSTNGGDGSINLDGSSSGGNSNSGNSGGTNSLGGSTGSNTSGGTGMGSIGSGGMGSIETITRPGETGSNGLGAGGTGSNGSGAGGTGSNGGGGPGGIGSNGAGGPGGIGFGSSGAGSGDGSSCAGESDLSSAEDSNFVPTVYTCNNAGSDRYSNFVNPSYPYRDAATGICMFRLHILPRVCQVRVDLVETNLAPPTEGVCVKQYMSVQGTVWKPGVQRICGTNTDNHFYLEVKTGSTSPYMEIAVSSLTTQSYRWGLWVTQINCDRPSAIRAPEGCFQYFPLIKGEVKSFSFEDSQYYSDQHYRICIGAQPLTCSVTFSSKPNEFMLEKYGSISEVPFDRSGMSSLYCVRDYLRLPDGSPDGGQHSSSHDRYCGGHLASSHGAATPSPITSRITSRIVAVEFHAGIPMKYEARAHGPGFKVSFQQNFCPVDPQASPSAELRQSQVPPGVLPVPSFIQNFHKSSQSQKDQQTPSIRNSYNDPATIFTREGSYMDGQNGGNLLLRRPIHHFKFFRRHDGEDKGSLELSIDQEPNKKNATSSTTVTSMPETLETTTSNEKITEPSTPPSLESTLLSWLPPSNILQTNPSWLSVAPPSWVIQASHHSSSSSAPSMTSTHPSHQSPWFYQSNLKHPQDMINLKPEGFIGFHGDSLRR